MRGLDYLFLTLITIMVILLFLHVVITHSVAPTIHIIESIPS